MSSMYKPAPPRPRKTNITRARTGCSACKERRRKCDEKKPVCGACLRLNTPCEQAPKFKFRTPIGQSGRSNGETVSKGKAGGQIIRFSPATERQGSEASGGNHMVPIKSSDTRFVMETGAFSQAIPRALKPSRDPAAPIRFYSDAWQKLCLPSLQSALQDPIFNSSTIISEMVTALSACRLSRMHPQRKVYKTSNLPGLCFRPDSGHELVSHGFYGSVMRRMAQWTQQDFEANSALGLAVLILFCYAESSMGTFKAYWVHSKGTTHLIQNYASRMLSAYPRGVELLGAWVEIEMQMWWRRLYFSTPSFQLEHRTLALDPALETSLRAKSQKGLVLLALCESQRLSNYLIISHWAQHVPDSQQFVNASLGLFGSATISEFAVLLAAQGVKLDQWEAPAPILDDLADTTTTAISDSGLQVEPLRFESHTAAMSYAYYIAARVMQCPGPLESLGLSDMAAISEAFTEAEAWIVVLLRIAAGIDWKSCIQLNVYSIGLSSLLLACILRSRMPAIGQWAETWLESQMEEGTLEEGSFPVFQTLAILRLINRERSNGMDVFAPFQTEDDGGGRGKLGSYHSQLITSMLLYGRSRVSGEFYAYYRDL